MLKQGLLSLALIGAGTIGFSATAANAVTLPAAPQPAVQIGTDAGNLVEVKHRRDHNRDLRRYWDRKRDGDRCRKRYGNCRHYYRGWYYSSPWWTLPLIGGSIILGNQNYNRGYGNAHIRWCEDRYRSYNVRTNTWVSYSGEVRQCISPYS
jgi:hypothetical protein